MCFFIICLPPGRLLFLTPGMGMGGGGTIWDNVGNLLGTFWIHFRTMLGHICNKYMFSTKITFLEMAHSNFVSFILTTLYQPLIWTSNNKKHVSGVSKWSDVSQMYVIVYIFICCYFVYHISYTFIYLIFLYIVEAHTA